MEPRWGAPAVSEATQSYPLRSPGEGGLRGALAVGEAEGRGRSAGRQQRLRTNDQQHHSVMDFNNYGVPTHVASKVGVSYTPCRPPNTQKNKHHARKN